MAYGATREEWNHLELVLGLTEDLLPVVSNPTAKISPHSKMKALGKTPSEYNGNGFVHGLVGWTQFKSTSEDIARYMKNPDYGACVITRDVRVWDIDIEDPVIALKFKQLILSTLRIDLPVRCRENSGKLLLAFRLKGPCPKRRVTVEGGVIELLGDGQQFVACGTHPSGARYQWVGGLPDTIPEITQEQVELVWAELAKFATEAPVTSHGRPRARGERLDVPDPVADFLEKEGLVSGHTAEGLIIECPWAEDHSEDTTGGSATVWLLAGTQGYERGHFKCMHAHCQGRSDTEFFEKIGYRIEVDDVRDLYPELPDEEVVGEAASPTPKSKERFRVIPDPELITMPPAEWLIKGLIPRQAFATLFGESGAGKSFLAIDLAASVARGVAWRGLTVQQGPVLYIAAEGGRGMVNRMKAYIKHHGITGAVGIDFIIATPNLLIKQDVEELNKAVKAQGKKYALIIIDTFAQVTAGGNEKDGEDMSVAVRSCILLGEATGATVMLVHHSGKDLTKGARGWSGVKAANDTEIEIGKRGVIRVTKQKDGDDGGRWGFTLKTIELGRDAEDEPVTSCVMVEAQIIEEHADRPKGRWELLVWTTLGEMAIDGGGVNKDALVKACLEHLEAGIDLRDARRKVQRAISALVTREKLQVEEEDGVEFVYFVEM